MTEVAGRDTIGGEQAAGSGELPSEVRNLAMLCHLLALVGLAGNGIGFLLGPLIIWLLKKEEHPFIDAHGKESVNFQLTMFIAMFVSAILIFILIGIFLVFAVAMVMTILPIIGAIKASSGEEFRYPLCIRFIR